MLAIFSRHHLSSVSEGKEKKKKAENLNENPNASK